MIEGIRAVLVDDHVLFRQGLRGLVEQRGIQVVGEASDGYEAVEVVKATTPHLVLMDVCMPNMNGIEATRRICDESHAPRVLGLSMQAVQRTAQEMLQAGASGYVVKDCDCEELLRAVLQVVEGNVFLSPSITTMVVHEFVAGIKPDGETPFVQLTPREREVLQLVAEGVSTKEVAGRLGISVKTAHTHRQNIMLKLNIDGVAGLTRYAIREGIVQP